MEEREETRVVRFEVLVNLVFLESDIFDYALLVTCYELISRIWGAQ